MHGVVDEPNLDPLRRYLPFLDLLTASIGLFGCESVLIRGILKSGNPVSFEKIVVLFLVLTPAVSSLIAWVQVRKLTVEGEITPRASLSVRTLVGGIVAATYLALMFVAFIN